MRKITEMLSMVDHDEKCASFAKNRKISVADADDFISAVEATALSEQQLEDLLLTFRKWVEIRDSIPKTLTAANMIWPGSLFTKSIRLQFPEYLVVSFENEAKFKELVTLLDELIV